MSSSPVVCNIPSGSEHWDWCPGPLVGDGGCEGLSARLNVSTTFNGDYGQAVVSIVSSSLSCLGSLLIVFSYCKWKDIRTGSRSVITFLAIADFFTAFGYIIGSSNYAIHLNQPPGSLSCSDFTTICTIQSFITSWSSISSFLWTSALALYLYCTVVHSQISVASKLIPVFHVVCWGAPILVCLPLLATGKLGYSPYAAATWCYIAQPVTPTDHGLSSDTILWILLGGKLWEILSYIVVVGLYASIKFSVRKQTKRGEAENSLSAGLVSVVRRADRKLTFIPIVFVFLRIWGTLQFFYALGVAKYIFCACTSDKIANWFHVLGYLQALGDGGQGWGNVLLYVIASDKIRTRLLGQFFGCCSTKESSRNDPPPRRPKANKLADRSDGVDHHAGLVVNAQPIAMNIEKQSVSYHSTLTHETTTTIN